MAKKNKRGIPDGVDEDLRGLYEQIISVGEQAIAFIKEKFDTQNIDRKVKFKFEVSNEDFNGFARKVGDCYEICIQANTVSLIRTLFDGVLEPQGILSELNTQSRDKGEPVDNAPFRKKMTLDGFYELIPVTSERLKLVLSSMLTEISCTFIVFHEVAHIVLGHAEHSARHYQNSTIFEYYNMSKILENQANVMRASEVDADTLAAQLLAMFIVSFKEAITRDADYKEIFSLLKAEVDVLEHLTGLAMAALSCVFIYMSHSLNALQKESYHPYPLLRVNKIRSKVVEKVHEQQGIDDGKEYDAFENYARQFMTSMVAMNIIPFPDHPGMDRKKMTRPNTILINDADKYRHLYDEYAWIPSSSWFLP